MGNIKAVIPQNGGRWGYKRDARGMQDGWKIRKAHKTQPKERGRTWRKERAEGRGSGEEGGREDEQRGEMTEGETVKAITKGEATGKKTEAETAGRGDGNVCEKKQGTKAGGKNGGICCEKIDAARIPCALSLLTSRFCFRGVLLLAARALLYEGRCIGDQLHEGHAAEGGGCIGDVPRREGNASPVDRALPVIAPRRSIAPRREIAASRTCSTGMAPHGGVA